MLAPGWENRGQLTVQMPSCSLSLSLHPGPTLGLTPTVRDCTQLIQAGGLSGGQPLPATVEKERTKSWGAGGQKRQKQDWSSAPQVCAHPPEVSVSFYFPLSLGRPLLLEATPPLPSLSSWTLGTTLQTPAPVPRLLCDWDHLNRLLLALPGPLPAAIPLPREPRSWKGRTKCGFEIKTGSSTHQPGDGGEIKPKERTLSVLGKRWPLPDPAPAPGELAQQRMAGPWPAWACFSTCEMGPGQPRAGEPTDSISGLRGLENCIQQPPPGPHGATRPPWETRPQRARRWVGSTPKGAQDRGRGPAVRPAQGHSRSSRRRSAGAGLPPGGPRRGAAPPTRSGTAPGHLSSEAPLPPGRRAGAGHAASTNLRFPVGDPAASRSGRPRIGITGPAAPPGTGPASETPAGPIPPPPGLSFLVWASSPQDAGESPPPNARLGAHRQTRHDLDRAAVAKVPSGLRRRLSHGRRRLLRAARPPRGVRRRPFAALSPADEPAHAHARHARRTGRSGERGSRSGGAHSGRWPGRRWPPRGKLGPGASRARRWTAGRGLNGARSSCFS